MCKRKRGGGMGIEFGWGIDLEILEPKFLAILVSWIPNSGVFFRFGGFFPATFPIFSSFIIHNGKSYMEELLGVLLKITGTKISGEL